MRPVIEKELLHYDILFTLDKAGLLSALTFQGGTSLRLCYGLPRQRIKLEVVLPFANSILYRLDR